MDDGDIGDRVWLKLVSVQEQGVYPGLPGAEAVVFEAVSDMENVVGRQTAIIEDIMKGAGLENRRHLSPKFSKVFSQLTLPDRLKKCSGETIFYNW